MNRSDKQVDPKISLGKFQFLPASVKITGRPAIEEWLGPFQFALWCQRASPWWIGDILNAGDAHFGEVFSQACEGYISGDQLQRYESVARRVLPENRNPLLSWSSHASVARLDGPGQRKLLAEAVKRGWNSEDLRKQARKLQANQQQEK